MIYLLIYFLIVLLLFAYCNVSPKLKKPVDYIVVLSASREYVTTQRLKTGIDLMREKYPESTIVTCGKFHAKLMKNYLEQEKVKNYIILNKSTNTYEDAYYTKKLVKKNNRGIVIVTSPTHLRRSYHTFKRLFKTPLYCYPSNIFFSYDGILFPTGLLGVLVNAYRDYKYNT